MGEVFIVSVHFLTLNLVLTLQALGVEFGVQLERRTRGFCYLL